MSTRGVQLPRGTAAKFAVSGITRQIDLHVVATLSVSVEARDAATEHVRRAEIHADEWDEEYGPLWLGHGIHRAFLAGVNWARAQEE